MSTFLQDLRYSMRALAKRPMYALVTILVLAIAIGANTTVFSVVSGLFLRALPYPDGERLVAVHNSYDIEGLGEASVSIPDYLDRRERADSLEELGLYMVRAGTLSGDGQPEQLLAVHATPSLFDVLGIGPALGRVFNEQEATPGNDRVAVLSHRPWTTRFGAQADAVGRQIRLDGETYRVVGVMPRTFGFPSTNVDLWEPFAFTPEQTSDAQRGMEFSRSVGRLKPGASVESLNAELDAIVHGNVEQGRERPDIEDVGFTGRAEPLRDMLVGDLEQMLLILQAIVLAVLLIACANIANLQLARAAVRTRELSLRAALGAGGRRIAALVLAESALLAIVGAGAGVLLAQGGLELVRALGLDRGNLGFEFALDGRVLGFTAGVAALAALLAGLLPLGSVLGRDLARSIRSTGRRGAGGGASQPFRNVLVVVQVALSVALLVGAGLLAKSFYEMQREGPGFDTEGMWTARIALPDTRYDGAAAARFFERALEELAALPGVGAAAFTSSLPFAGGDPQGSYAIEGYTPPAGAPGPHARQRIVSEGYSAALGIPVVEGRNFAANEPERVAIVDETLAQKYWPGGGVLGQRVLPFNGDEWHTVIGVVPAVKHTTLVDEPAKETIYWHYKQRPRHTGQLMLRTALPPAQVTRAARQAVLDIDPDVPVFNVMPMSGRVAESLGPQRTPMVLMLVFAGIAFTLAVVGVYSVLTWAVTQRFSEIGVRVALGARSRDVVRMVVGQGGRLVGAGLVFGAVAALGLGRVLASQVHEVSPLDPAVLGTAFAGLAAAGLLVSWLPARRAARIEPMQALREE